ncbi:MAG: hypothetical protein GY862_34695 [Gammaproteobacteria bacterium]|nr:hypothetical protein [Gammaproteobacteria bacterium]
MDALLKAHFPLIANNNCLEANDSSVFHVYDDPTAGRCRIDTAMEIPEEQSFVVDNPDNKQIRLLAVDHCLLFDGEGKKCDCILYDDTYFCFIELKDVISDDHQKRRRARKDAKPQLLATIELLQDSLPASALADITQEAYLCVGRRPARPAIKSESQAAMRDFAAKGVSLYDGCRKAF